MYTINESSHTKKERWLSINQELSNQTKENQSAQRNGHVNSKMSYEDEIEKEGTKRKYKKKKERKGSPVNTYNQATWRSEKS
jgi:hypothetical protein